MKSWQIISLIFAITLTFISEFFISHDPSHKDFWWSNIPFFWALFGFVGCILLILLAKYFLIKIVHRKESYYDEF